MWRPRHRCGRREARNFTTKGVILSKRRDPSGTPTLCPPTGSAGARREHPEPMPVRIETNERIAEIHPCRRLRDFDAAVAPPGMRGVDCRVALDCDGDLAPPPPAGRGPDLVAPPQPQ